MTEHTTPACCEAWESWADSANWFVDTEGTYRMPHLKGTRHRFNFCPSCGAERRSAIVVSTALDDFDALQRRLNEPGRYDPRIAKVLSTPAPWDEGCDKTSASADQ